MSDEDGTVDLYVGRHTEYHEDGPDEGKLTADGTDQAKFLAALFGRLFPPGDGEPPLVLHSGAARALALAELVAAATGGEAQKCDWALRGPRTKYALLDACEGRRAVIVCGHEPLLDSLMKLTEGHGYRANKGEFHLFRLNTTAGTVEYVRQMTAGAH